ncbi:MAG: hypothetical protein Q8899_01995 [Weeping tea tree witches'-broom phytoplasma]|uniref:hypothetical protein n=1 Tax=Candidatus Phytoplasma melaleucae TaxID=2982630 RepID=UPI0029399568|nr:hypothetical protein [Weeping tea tree witches'-broom phytoplasma]
MKKKTYFYNNVHIPDNKVSGTKTPRNNSIQKELTQYAKTLKNTINKKKNLPMKKEIMFYN